MKSSQRIKTIIIETVCLLYILLFVYAALNKILDFENFQVQLGQSPLLSAYAGWVSWGVPIIELLIVSMLFFNRTRYVALFSTFCLMVMFSSYIFIMLHFSPFVPCSCGGILEKLSWNQHLIFNIVFVFIALVALLIARTTEEPVYIIKKRIQIPVIIIGTFCSIGIVAFLFVLSENTIHYRNNFTRRFPHHPTVNTGQMNLKYDSYYIAGYDRGKIYLGNTTAPLTVTVIDTTLKSKQEFTIQMEKNKFPFTAPRLVVKSPYFYFTDGTVSCAYRGNITDWKAYLVMYKKAYFSLFEPISGNRGVIRASGSKTHENVLGTIGFTDSVHLNYHLLDKQIDGIFDTDGMLLYNSQLNKILYTYYYLNKFIIADTLLNLDKEGHTIDTISRAQIKVVAIRSKKITTLAKQPIIVNKKTATYGKYLFVNAALIGKFEPETMWKMASIIDVYDIEKGTYAFSFYIYDKGDKKLSEFGVYGNLVISLTGKYLTIDKISSPFYKPVPF